MKYEEKQIEEIETIIKSNLAEGSFANAFARKVAIQISEYYQPKLPEDSVVLSKDDYEAMQFKIEQFTKYAENGRQLREHYCNEASKEMAEKLLSELYYIARLYYANSANVLAWAKDKAKQLGIEIRE